MTYRLFKRYGSSEWERIPVSPPAPLPPVDERPPWRTGTPLERGLSSGQAQGLYEIKGLKRPGQRLTPVFEFAITPGLGCHLRKAVVLSRKHVRSWPAFECMNVACLLAFRLKRSKDPAVLDYGSPVTCPECNGLYVMPLTFELDPRDVFLNSEEEWSQAPAGRLVRKKACSAR